MGINITTIYIKREEKSLFAYSFHYSLDHILVLSIKLIKRVKDFDKTRRNNVADGRYIYWEIKTWTPYYTNTILAYT